MNTERVDPLKFRNPMDEKSLRERLITGTSGNPIYDLAALAAGHQSAYTVDKLSWKLKQALPGIIATLAAEVEAENIQERERRMRPGPPCKR